MPRRESLGLSAALFPHSRHRVGPPAAKPSFVFVLIDDMGWADVGCNGRPFYETPNIDRLAAEGIRFTNAYAAARPHPSSSGLQPAETIGTPNGIWTWRCRRCSVEWTEGFFIDSRVSPPASVL